MEQVGQLVPVRNLLQEVPKVLPRKKEMKVSQQERLMGGPLWVQVRVKVFRDLLQVIIWNLQVGISHPGRI